MVQMPDDPEATAHLRRQLATISEFADLKSRCRIPPDPGSELANLSAALPDAPISIEESLAVGVECAYGAVDHLAHLLDQEASFPPIVLYNLLGRPCWVPAELSTQSAPTTPTPALATA